MCTRLFESHKELSAKQQVKREYWDAIELSCAPFQPQTNAQRTPTVRMTDRFERLYKDSERRHKEKRLSMIAQGGSERKSMRITNGKLEML